MRIVPKHILCMVCPVCHGDLMPLPEESSIDCKSCHRRYPVVDGIPVLIASRATLHARPHTEDD